MQGGAKGALVHRTSPKSGSCLRIPQSRWVALLLGGSLLYASGSLGAASGVEAEPALRAVRVVSLDQIDPLRAKEIVMSNGVKRLVVVDSAPIIILSDSPERIAGFV